MTRSIYVWILLFFSFAFRSFCQTDVEEKILQKIKGTNNDSVKVEYFTDLGYEFEFTDTSKALRYFGQAFSLSKKLKSDHLISMSLSGFGNFYIDNTNFDKARTYHRQALHYSIRSGKPQNIGRSFNNLGNIEYFKSNSGAALDYFLKACRQYEKSKDSVRLKAIYQNIGNEFLETGQFKQAASLRRNH